MRLSDGLKQRRGDVLDRLQAWVPAMQHFIEAIAQYDASGG